MHDQKHPLAGQRIRIKEEAGPELGGRVYEIEDWWDHLTGGSWGNARGNPAATKYAMRSSIGRRPADPTPLDDEVVYGHTDDGYGHLIHAVEIGEVL